MTGKSKKTNSGAFWTRFVSNNAAGPLQETSQTVSSWLQNIGLTGELLWEILSAYRSGNLAAKPNGFPVLPVPKITETNLGMTLDVAFRSIILPAFEHYFEPNREHISRFLNQIEFDHIDEKYEIIPHTIDRGPNTRPLVRMKWNERPEDLICLAHECAHALQTLTSSHTFTTALLRETCAFIGELALLVWLSRFNEKLYFQCQRVWGRENAIYLDKDSELLISGIKDSKLPYNYRMNYPVARLAANQFFNTTEPKDRLAIFNLRDKNVLDHLHLVAMASESGKLPNHLPPLHEHSDVTLQKYSIMGAMALLDVIYPKGQSEKPIGAYYKLAISNLEQNTVQLLSRKDKKPAAYAIWSQDEQSKQVLLLQQTAPFGDFLYLQKSLEKSLNVTGTVLSNNERSSRKVQVAWVD